MLLSPCQLGQRTQTIVHAEFQRSEPRAGPITLHRRPVLGGIANEYIRAA